MSLVGLVGGGWKVPVATIHGASSSSFMRGTSMTSALVSVAGWRGCRAVPPAVPESFLGGGGGGGLLPSHSVLVMIPGLGQRSWYNLDGVPRVQQRGKQTETDRCRQPVGARSGLALELDEVAGIWPVDSAVVGNLLSQVAGQPHVIAASVQAAEDRDVVRVLLQRLDKGSETGRV